MYYFGPVTVTHEGTNLGNTYGGGSLSLLTFNQEPISNDYDPSPRIYGGEGEFNFYSWSGVTIGSDPELYAFGEVVLSNSNATVTLYKCKILLAESMSIGTNEQKPFKVKFIFTPNDAGNIINFS